MTVPPEIVVRTVDQVFRDPAYDRTPSHRLLATLERWLGQALSWLIQAIARIPGGPLVIRWTLYTLVAILAIAIGYQIFQHYRETRGKDQIRFGEETPTDLWTESRRAAERGAYTDAAHLLYAAVLRTLVLRGLVRLHPSNTTGDYVRALRQGSDRTMLTQFTEFVRVYEVVIYRDGHCDRNRYEWLLSLGEPILRGQRAAA